MAGPNTLLLASAFAVITAAIYAYVGRVIIRRHVQGDARLASTLFATFWFGLGAATLFGSVNNVLGWAGVTDISVYVTIIQVSFLVIMIALWSLMYYLAYLFTGNRSLLVPISAFYLVFYAWLVYLIVLVDFDGLTVNEWNVQLHAANEAHPIVGIVFALALIVPPLIGAIAYARLFFKVEGVTQRYRIGLVSGTIVAWFGSSLIVSVLQVGASPVWQVASRIIGVVAAMLVYFAYRPPGWVRARYGIEAAEEQPA